MAMVVRLVLHTDEVLEKVERNKEAALTAAATEAQAAIKDYMVGGYDRPAYDTGALYRDVQYDFKDENTVDVGNTLGYAPYVHDGTYKMAARPYIRDGVMNAAEVIQEIFEAYISQGL